MDKKLVSKQEWEIDYCRKIAKEELKSIKNHGIVNEKSISRILKSYLKLTKEVNKMACKSKGNKKKPKK